jgi:glycosyltransferase involved in cell wall biosynthesis
VHLTALVDNLDHVCYRYRLGAFRPFLERAGHVLDLKPRPKSPWAWLRLVRQLPVHDCVIVQRKLLSAWQLYLLRQCGHRIIFDFDDAIFLRDSYSRRGPHDRRRQRGFVRMARSADAIAAGNDCLRDHARRAGGAAVTSVIATCVDAGRYPLAQHPCAGAGVELVWIGSASTLQGLQPIRPWLEELGRRQRGVDLKLVCNRFLELEHLPVRRCTWTEAAEAEELASADIGIAWVPDDLWSRGKCGLKVLQYMAAGLPVIANPVGVQAAMVRHGETGFLVETREQWLEAAGRLIHDPALRRRMGRAGRQLVEQEYSLSAGASKWLEMLGALDGTRKVADQANNSPRWARTPDLSTEPVVHDVA